MLWALDLDDFSNVCGCGQYPLLTTINVGLGRRPREHQFRINCVAKLIINNFLLAFSLNLITYTYVYKS